MNLDKRLNRAIRELRVATELKTGRRKRSFAKISVVGLGAGCVVALGVALLWPKPARAAGIEEMRQALMSVPACHSINSLGQESWQEGKKRRYLVPNKIDYTFDGEFTWTYQFQAGTLRKMIQPPEGFGMPIGSLDDIVDEFVRHKMPRPKITSSFETRNGVRRWIASFIWKASKNGGEIRNEYECDPVSKLPMRMNMTYRNPGQPWGKATVTDYDYPADIPDEMFVLKPRIGVTFIDNTDRKNPKAYPPKVERTPFPPNSGLEFGPIYVYRDPNGGWLKGKKAIGFQASAFRFHANGTADMWLKLGPKTNVYYYRGAQLQYALHGWKSAKDIPIKDWPGTYIDLMPGAWMQVRKGANAIMDEGFVRVDSESGQTKYTKIVVGQPTAPRIEIVPKGIRIARHDGFDQYEISAKGDLPK